MGKTSALVIRDLRGGRNGFDPPLMIPDDQCLEALNVDSWSGTLANKRGGSTALSTTFSSGGPFTGILGTLLRHVPGADETAAELWGFDSAGVNGRLAGAVTWTAPAFVDAVSNYKGVTGASLGGFFHLAYDSIHNRLHVWDPSLSKVRRSGLATPDPPTVATLGGAGLTFTRYYRIRVVDISGSDTRRRSEASTSVSLAITDDSGIRVTRPTLPGEDETHWEVEYATASAGPWYRASQVAAATSTYDDTASSLSTTTLSAVAGLNTPPPSAKFVVTDDNRLFLAGCHEPSGGYTTANDRRVWFTAVLGSTDVGDAERVPTSNYIGLEDSPTGIGGPMQGAIYVFAYRRIWKFVPTGVSTQPYQKFSIRKDLGAINQQGIVTGEDETGNPCLYFVAARGVYRIGANGIQYLGRDNEDIWEGINLAATGTVCHAVYHQEKRQVWVWIATGANNDPDTRLVFDVTQGRPQADGSVRGGWFRHTGVTARCSVMFASTVAAVMSAALKPYAGITTNNTIWRCDSAVTTDNGTNFQAYVDTREFGTVGSHHAVREGVLIGEVASGVTITVSVISDFGLSASVSATAVLTAAGSETRVQKRLEGLQTAGVGTFRLRIGDSAALAQLWTLDAALVNVTTQESLT